MKKTWYRLQWNLDKARGLICKIGIRLFTEKLTLPVDATTSGPERHQELAPQRTGTEQFELSDDLKRIIKSLIDGLNDGSQLTTLTEIHNFHVAIYKVLVLCDESPETQVRAVKYFNNSEHSIKRNDTKNLNKIADMMIKANAVTFNPTSPTQPKT